MTMRRLAPLVLGAILVLPAAAPAAAAGEDLERWYAEQLAELEARWAQPSALSADAAAALLTQAGLGASLPEGDALELLRWLRDHEASPAGAQVVGRAWVARTLLAGAAAQDDVWQQGFWDAYGVALTAVYLAASTLNDEMLPHDFALESFYYDFVVDAGCSGGWSSGYCWLRVTADLLALASFDVHYTTDLVLAQLPLSLETHLHWRCSWGCSVWVDLHLLDTVVAQQAAYVFAAPAVAGSPATRPTDSDLLQILYDRLGGIRAQKPREVTSATPVALLPFAVPAPPGGTPGLGDLLATGPVVNYVGLQVPPGMPSPGLPPLPPPPGPLGAAVAAAFGAASQVHMRERGAFLGPGDSTGLTVAYTMWDIRAWNLNLAFVRLKNVGTSYVGLPEPPGSFYYDAGWYFTGGGPNQLTEDFSLRDALV